MCISFKKISLIRGMVFLSCSLMLIKWWFWGVRPSSRSLKFFCSLRSLPRSRRSVITYHLSHFQSRCFSFNDCNTRFFLSLRTRCSSSLFRIRTPSQWLIHSSRSAHRNILLRYIWGRVTIINAQLLMKKFHFIKRCLILWRIWGFSCSGSLNLLISSWRDWSFSWTWSTSWLWLFFFFWKIESEIAKHIIQIYFILFPLFSRRFLGFRSFVWWRIVSLKHWFLPRISKIIKIKVVIKYRCFELGISYLRLSPTIIFFLLLYCLLSFDSKCFSLTPSQVIIWFFQRSCRLCFFHFW